LEQFNANYGNDFKNIVRNHDDDTVKSHRMNDFTVIIHKRMGGRRITEQWDFPEQKSHRLDPGKENEIKKMERWKWAKWEFPW